MPTASIELRLEKANATAQEAIVAALALTVKDSTGQDVPLRLGTVMDPETGATICRLAVTPQNANDWLVTFEVTEPELLEDFDP